MQYEVVRRVGRGVNGTVYTCRRLETGEIVAVKAVSLWDEDGALSCNVLREISIHQDLRHPNVVQLLDFLHDTHYMYYVQEAMQMHLGRYCTFVRANGIPHPRITKVRMLREEVRGDATTPCRWAAW